MPIPIPGTYRIRSLMFPNQMFDLIGGGVAPNTPVAGHHNNNDSQNMLWTVQVVDQPTGLGAGVVGSPDIALMTIQQRPNLGEYWILAANGQACALVNGDDNTPVILEDQVDGNCQGWIFCPV
ncbi:hypothetical protein K503DRAFT_608329 [Rhizopogon vinicolor AM-OR11-026]|uniref:Ricin B lectin domain-containing protein n=1 Tax=Rhizopogon vinicolor AM-OR11-026 TaxID=1314800 RepID=A0A1B7MIJ8_9AGAM|nr:hypothetical protein K503DRAFT_608329 [Rhizopogon vinicolor AM-OR11-026]